MPVFNHIPRVEPDMQGATTENAGKSGLVPAPTAGEGDRALMADGTWQVPTNAKNADKLDGVGLYDNYPINTDADGFNKKIAVPILVSVYGSENTEQLPVPKIAIIGYKKDGVVDNLFGILGVVHTSITNDDGTITEKHQLALQAFSNNEYNSADMLVSAAELEIEASNGIKIHKRSGRPDDQKVHIELIGSISVSDGFNVSEIDAGTEYLNLFGKNSGVILANIARTGSADAGPYFAPITTENTRLGHGNAKWSAVYAVTSSIVTSDRNLKKDINPFTEAYEKLFFDLEPSTFKLKSGESNRTHTGFISQDVEEALEKNGLSALDFAGFCKDQKTKTIVDENGEEKEVPVEGEYNYSLRYEEFIALNTHMIQKLYAQVEELQKEVESLKGEILCLQKQ